ncbi:hypothetical protein CDL12_05168 [Handroanthus impetiginosus]|uniref:BURP domain-containing protein n=1 Tax=Handroanthus impetiginosus TaxID=429701 RepID=A0A2G9HX81_9LAMI|nr:hypothetical protein CDL12_05168 [Handroanthus impetiginosus]
MGIGCSPLIFLLHSFFLLQCLQATEGHRKNLEDKNNGIELHDHSSLSHMDHIDPELNVFFHYNDLKLGNKLPIYFEAKDPSTSPHLLSKEESDSIPFSSPQLPYILKLFTFSDDSKQAKAMKSTLHHCEFPPMKGETKFCATSLEFLLDSISEIFGPNSKFSVLTTNYLSESISLLQNYTISEPPAEIMSPRIVSCHTLPYPYAVLYCHSQNSDNKMYRVLLEGEDGGRVEATAICHMDTSEWDPDHVAFHVLKTGPGDSPVCHFFPPDSLVWIQHPRNNV